MSPITAGDRSNGYQAVANQFMTVRSAIGTDTVRAWAQALPGGSAVLDLGCGHGIPITHTLIEQGLDVYGIDASADMIEALRRRFPTVHAECNTVEASDLFGRTFDGVTAWGLIFLLPPDSQRLLVRKVSHSLNAGGRFLFTAPQQACEWTDSLTGLTSVSLGAESYGDLLRTEGLKLVGELRDEGDNHYYLAAKPA